MKRLYLKRKKYGGGGRGGGEGRKSSITNKWKYSILVILLGKKSGFSQSLLSQIALLT